MASPGNRHCANYICTLSFPMSRLQHLANSVNVTRCRPTQY